MQDINERLKKQKEQQDEEIRKEMVEKISKQFDMIVTAAEENTNKIPESTFVKSFLPYFCGEKDLDKTNVIGLWIGIAGSITSKVHIVNEKNEIIFTVPPIVDTSIFDVTNNKNAEKFKFILLNYKMYGNQTPMSAKKYLDKTIDKRLDQLQAPSTEFTENQKAWNDIFIRYGKIQQKAVANTKPINSFGDDELIYD